MRHLAALAAVLILALPLYAQHPPGQGPYRPQLAAGTDGVRTYEWREYHGQPGMFYLHAADGRRLGAWKESTCQFWPLDQQTWAWGAECRPPCPLPATEQPVLNFGLVTSKINQKGPRYLIGDKEVSREQARKAVQTGTLEDDSHKLRVTVFGSPAKTKPVAEAIAASDVGSKVLVQQYQPDDPMVKGLGFKTEADPTVYVQAPEGKVLHRSRGPLDPQAAVQQVRKANSGYDPNKDPDVNNPPGPLPFKLDFSSVPQWAWGALATLAIVLVLHRRKEK